MALVSTMSIYPYPECPLALRLYLLHRVFRTFFFFFFLIIWFTKLFYSGHSTRLASCYGFNSRPDVQCLRAVCHVMCIPCFRMTHLHASTFEGGCQRWDLVCWLCTCPISIGCWEQGPGPGLGIGGLMWSLSRIVVLLLSDAPIRGRYGGSKVRIFDLAQVIPPWYNPPMLSGLGFPARESKPGHAHESVRSLAIRPPGCYFSNTFCMN